MDVFLSFNQRVFMQSLYYLALIEAIERPAVVNISPVIMALIP